MTGETLFIFTIVTYAVPKKRGNPELGYRFTDNLNCIHEREIQFYFLLLLVLVFLLLSLSLL